MDFLFSENVVGFYEETEHPTESLIDSNEVFIPNPDIMSLCFDSDSQMNVSKMFSDFRKTH